MIEISFAKLLVLALIALIVLGPEKLPVVARTAGALIRRVRNGWDTVRAEVERELEVEEIRSAARELVAQKDAVQASLNSALKQVQDVAVTATSSAAPARPAISQVQPAVAQDEQAAVALPAAAEAIVAEGSSSTSAAMDAGAADDLFSGAELSRESNGTEAVAAPELAHGNH